VSEYREDGCQNGHPMVYCSVCGTYMHCKDEEGPWRRRVDGFIDWPHVETDHTEWQHWRKGND
jgi:hypothetical protein